MKSEPTKTYWRKCHFTHYFEARRFAAWLVEQGYKTHSNQVPAINKGAGFWGFQYGPDKQEVKRIEFTESRQVWITYGGRAVNI